MKFTLLLSFIIILFQAFNVDLHAQNTQSDKLPHSLYLLQLSDKINSPYNVFKPQDFLTSAALDRRSTQGIEINELDIPVDPKYLDKIRRICPVHSVSRWFNAVAVHCSSDSVLQQLKQLPFVLNSLPLGKFRKRKKAKFYTRRPPIDSSNHQSDYYGKAAAQIKMLGGHHLHHLGYTGQSVKIAVVDGGFNNAYRMWVFDSLYLENRLLGTHDFVDGDDYVYQSSTHGSSVLSTMAAKRPHLMVGTAPDASYYLFITEDVKGEYRAEEFNWVVAMEYADSVGADVVNSSMGYNQFRDTSMSYCYEEMNGQTALISRGAAIAASKGLLIVNAMGNDGSKPWHYLFAPADVKEVFSVGAITPANKTAEFSSRGPSADGRIKPDIVALGSSTAYATMTKYDVALGEGTSYACPVMAGMVASLKSAFPEHPNQRLKDAIRSSGHKADTPDFEQGYGLPDFLKAYLTLSDNYLFIQQKTNTVQKSLIFGIQDKIIVQHDTSMHIEVDYYDFWANQVSNSSYTMQGSNCSFLRLNLIEDKMIKYLKIKIGTTIHYIHLNR